MAVAWLAYETTTTTGIGNYALNGALDASKTRFSLVLSDGDPVWYVVHGDGSNFEVNLGTYVDPTDQLTRGVIFSTNSNNPVNWAPGTKAIYGIEPIFDPEDFLLSGNNLSEIQDTAAARINLGLTAMATADPQNFNQVLRFVSGGRLVLPVGLSLWAT